MALTPTQSDYYTRVRNANRKLWDAVNELLDLQRQWNALDYGKTLPDAGKEDGTIDGIKATDVGAVVFDTADAFAALLDQGKVPDSVKSGLAANMARLL